MCEYRLIQEPLKKLNKIASFYNLTKIRLITVSHKAAEDTHDQYQ